MEDSLAENNDDSYIEIELESCAEVVPTCVSSEEEDEKEEELKLREGGEEYDDELRISISSTIALPDVVVDCSEKVESSVDPVRESDSADSDPSDDQGRFKDAAGFWENRSPDHHGHVTLETTMPFNCCTRQNSRVKEGSMRRTNGGGMIMNMLIKFRGIKLSTLISSLMKLPRPPCQDHNNDNNKGHTRKYCRTILQCYHQKNMVVNPSSSGSQENRSSKRLSKPNWDLNNNNNNNSNEGSFRSSRRSSWNRSVVEIDLGALKGMFSAVGIAQKSRSSSKRKSCSNVSSCDNSPIHEGFSFTCTDNSIQAAIAYCKTSSGQTSDFSF
ncbi:uncharacterized protein LOC114733077 [Neltuma alba]|uniref:uncharacterized protein LOC114733077 n=1 Tax=Neltuma alba TaxID=207710 RepID=UPI0010A3DB30|nr:uncharacterized protein LOC114733077 [Prosopis alba]